MKVTIIGCGEAFDERFPNTSALVEGPTTMLCDCGYSVPPAIWKAGIDRDAIDTIYISHAHADHYFGLPALLGRMWEDGRKKPLTIVSQEAVLAQIRDLMDYGYRTLSKRFEYAIEYRAAEDGLDVGGFMFSFAPTIHSVTNLLVRLEAGGKSVCYSGDGMFTAESRERVRGADLVIHEAYWFEESPVHGDIPRLLTMAKEEGVKELALVHVHRWLRGTGNGRIEEAMRHAGLKVTMPEPGAVWTL